MSDVKKSGPSIPTEDRGIMLLKVSYDSRDVEQHILSETVANSPDRMDKLEDGYSSTSNAKPDSAAFGFKYYFQLYHSPPDPEAVEGAEVSAAVNAPEWLVPY